VTTSQRTAISLLSVLLTLAIAAPCLGVLNSPHNPKMWLTATVGFFSMVFSSVSQAGCLLYRW
jgi:hypothetical protein